MTRLKRANPLYLQLKERIRFQISSVRLKPNEKVPSIRDLADRHDVSEITARRAITDLVSEGYLYARHGKGTFVKGIPPVAPKFVVLDIPGFEDNYFSLLISGLKKEAGKYKHRLALAGGRKTSAAEIINMKSVSGIFVRRIAPYSEGDIKYFEALKEARVPFVLLDVAFPGLKCSSVVFDNQDAMYRASAHLVKLGADRVVYFGSPAFQIAGERLNGFVKAMAERKIKPENYLIINTGEYLTAKKDYLEKIRAFKPKAVIIAAPLLTAAIISDLKGFVPGIMEENMVCAVVEENFRNYIDAGIMALVKPVSLLARAAAAIIFGHINNKLKAPLAKIIHYQVAMPGGMARPSNMNVLEKPAPARLPVMLDV